MTAQPPPAVVAQGVPAALRGQVSVRDVLGGRPTHPLGVSRIDSETFARALEESLAGAGLAASAPESARYLLAVTLTRVEPQPVGLALTVSATALYDLIERESNRSVWTRSITRSHTANFGEAFSATRRLQLANEGAARANIRAFVDELVGSWPAGS